MPRYEENQAVNSLAIAGIVFVCVFGGAMAGMVLRRFLPESHLREESKEVIKLGTGLIATMVALVIGLLVATATSDFATQSNSFQDMATNLVLLDRVLAHYGPEANQSREQLRRTVASAIDRRWPENTQAQAILAVPTHGTDGRTIVDSIRELAPRDDAQRALQSQAFQIAADLARSRWLMSEQHEGSIPMPFLVVLAFWLFVLFVSFGLFSPRNPTVIAVLLLCALSVAGAILLILDLDQPFEGFIQISGAPLRDAREQLGR
jgi:hypothetical protein